MARARAIISKSAPQLKKSVTLLSGATNGNYGPAQNVGFGFVFSLFVKANGATGTNSVVVEARDEANNWAVWKTVPISAGDSTVLLEAISSVSVIRARVSPYAGGSYDVRCDVLNVATETGLAEALAKKIGVTPQTLTTEEKAQARANIGAGTGDGAGGPGDVVSSAPVLSGAVVTTAHTLSGSLDVTKILEVVVISGPTTLTMSATPATNARGVIRLSNSSGSDQPLNLPSSPPWYSENRGSNITAITIPGNWEGEMSWCYTGTKFHLKGDPLTQAQAKAALAITIGDTTGTVPTNRGGTGLTALGSALQIPRVNAEGTALEYVDPTAGSGDVTAAAAFAADNRIVRSNGTGKGVQASNAEVDDNGTVNVLGDGIPGSVELSDGHATAPKKIRISAPTTIATTHTLVLPGTPPTAGQVMRVASVVGTIITLEYYTP
jgi:hypothetical protein